MKYLLESHKGLFLAYFYLIFFVCVTCFFFVPDIDIANYVDDDTPHAINKHRETVLTDPEQESNILFELVYR